MNRKRRLSITLFAVLLTGLSSTVLASPLRLDSDDGESACKKCNGDACVTPPEGEKYVCNGGSVVFTSNGTPVGCQVGGSGATPCCEGWASETCGRNN